MRRNSLIGCTLAVCMLIATPAFAEGDAAPAYGESNLSGDWQGKRSELWQSGWSVDAVLKVDTLRLRGAGGQSSGAMTNLDLKLGMDLEKIAGWDGTTALVHVLDNRGHAVNDGRTLMGVSNIEVPVSTTRLFQAWLQKSFLDDNFLLLAGLYPIDSEFFNMESASLLINPSFGTSADLGLTRGPSIFNNSALGIRAKWLANEKTIYGMAAVLDGIPNDPDHPKRTAVKLSGSDGAFYIGELGWTPKETAHAFSSSGDDEKYNGVSKYALGAWHYTSTSEDFVNASEKKHQQGAYIFAERTLFGLGESGRDVGVFARFSEAAGNSLKLDKSINLGTRIRGLLAARPDDTLLIGWTRSKLAGKYRQAELVLNGNDTAPYEEVMEITWRAAITPYLAVQPVFQQVRNPGGMAGAEWARLFGARFEVAF